MFFSYTVLSCPICMQQVHTPSEYHKMFDGFSGDFVGSCWCGADRYCMCTPSLAIDTVIEMVNEEHGEV